MSQPRLSRLVAAAVGVVMTVTAAPAFAAPAATPAGPDGPVGDTPVLPRQWEPATASPAQQADGAPTITPADGTRVAGRQTLVASPTSGALASLSVDGEDVTAAPNLGEGTSALHTEVGSNAMGRGFSNYLIVNGTRVAIHETWSSATAVLPIPNELLVVGQNAVTVGAGPRFADCGANYDDFQISDPRLVIGEGTEIRDDANPGSIWVGDGMCGSNTDRSTTVDLTFTVDAEPAADAGLLHVLDTTQLDDGPVEVVATTEGGEQTTHSLVVDNTGPALDASVPADGSTLIGDAVIGAEVSDDSGLRAEPTLTLDGEPVAAGDAISSDELAAGDHELVIAAEDELGNTSRHVVEFTSAPNSPALGAMTPQPGSTVDGAEVTLDIEVTDPNDADVDVTFLAAEPAFPDTAHQGTAVELPGSQLDFTGQRAADTDALRYGDGEVLRSPAAEGVTYQRFDVPVEADGEDLVVSWTGEVDPARGVRLHAWDTQDQAWDQLTDARGTADGATELSGAAGTEHVDGGEVHLLVEGYDPFADDIADEPDEAFRDPETYDFSLAHNTDTQFLAEGAARGETEEERAEWAHIYESISQWIGDNAEERKIAYAFHTGDIIQRHVLVSDDPQWEADVRAEFEAASRAQAILDESGVPNGVLAGNHDNMWGLSDELYNEYFGPERYEALSDSWENAEYGGPWREGDNSNHYDLFTAGGLEFVAVHLAYHTTAEERAWADEILKQYPDRNAIVATHAYLGQSTQPDGRGAGYSHDGQAVYDDVVSQNSNVFLVLGGHVHGVGTNVLTDVAEPGHNVVEMLADYQGYQVDGERKGGFFRMLQFDVDRSEMTVDTYSPWLDNHGATEFDNRERYDGTEDELTLPVNLSTRTTSIATDAVSVAVLSDDAIGTDTAAAGQSASTDWTGLQPGTTYGWYAVAENATEGRTVSPLATFSTAGDPEEPGEPGEPGPQRHGFFLNDGWDGEPEHVFQYGRHTDEVLIGDWDGDGTDTITMRRGDEYHVSNAPRGGEAEEVFRYGRAEDVVLVGDWDADGADTLAVRRGDEYHVLNTLRGGAPDEVISYGRPQDAVVVGDWDGDGADTFAVRRGATYHVKNAIAGGDADQVFTYGRAGDVTLAGDWDGDGQDTFAVRRGQVFHVNNSLTGGDAELSVAFGRAGDEVYVGDWDGDGRDTLGVRRTP